MDKENAREFTALLEELYRMPVMWNVSNRLEAILPVVVMGGVAIGDHYFGSNFSRNLDIVAATSFAYGTYKFFRYGVPDGMASLAGIYLTGISGVNDITRHSAPEIMVGITKLLPAFAVSIGFATDYIAKTITGIIIEKLRREHGLEKE